MLYTCLRVLRIILYIYILPRHHKKGKDTINRRQTPLLYNARVHNMYIYRTENGSVLFPVRNNNHYGEYLYKYYIIVVAHGHGKHSGVHFVLVLLVYIPDSTTRLPYLNDAAGRGSAMAVAEVAQVFGDVYRKPLLGTPPRTLRHVKIELCCLRRKSRRWRAIKKKNIRIYTS